jgi:hypothetical protein
VNVHSTGTARARIEARDIVISGAVDGSVVARDRVSIGESATLNGDLQSSRLRVDEGATVNATIAMRAAGDAPPARRKERHESEVDVTGSPASAASDANAYAEGSDGSASDDSDGAPETSAVFSGADSEEG